MSRKATYREIGGPTGHLARLETFKGNSMSAEIHIYGGDSWGGLANRCYHDEGCDLHKVHHRIYVVVSYSTAIATYNLNTGKVRITDKKYSATTSRQTNLCRAWLGRQWFWHTNQYGGRCPTNCPVNYGDVAAPIDR